MLALNKANIESWFFFFSISSFFWCSLCTGFVRLYPEFIQAIVYGIFPCFHCRCSDGADRHRAEWESNGCGSVAVKKGCEFLLLLLLF